ncbi:hypothetical protein [Dyadobacter sandarakinus]|uniref:Uncharacterized protein n=1 Tax=Dyadobacter sandarakinus TaxID=2747268 RepID=A0ABX7I137_9BACT|nr:hypothetical protein [Dyadobacter sandarakinus]QRQ99738.1 hypothetical protein HWI92_01800 [Dyadobacter sandarakinus]
MDWLKEGDIVFLEKGMDVYAQIPLYFFRNQHPYSKEVSVGQATVGVKRSRLSSESALRDEIADMIKFIFAYRKMPLDTKILNRFLLHQLPPAQDNEFVINRGEYEVIKVSFGPGERRVYCRCLAEPKTIVYFFQQHNNFPKYPNMVAIRRVEENPK